MIERERERERERAEQSITKRMKEMKTITYILNSLYTLIINYFYQYMRANVSKKDNYNSYIPTL